MRTNEMKKIVLIAALAFASAQAMAGESGFYVDAGVPLQASNAQTNMKYMQTRVGAALAAGYEGDRFGGEVRGQWMPDGEMSENVETRDAQGSAHIEHKDFGKVSQSSVAAVARIYAFERESTFRPYAGVGVAYYALSGSLNDGSSVSGKIAPVFEAGVVTHVAPEWRVSLNVSYSPLTSGGVHINPLTVALSVGYSF